MSSTTCPKMTFFCGACRPYPQLTAKRYICALLPCVGADAHIGPRAGDGARPYDAGRFHSRGPRRSPAAGAGFAAGGEAKDLELAATLSRCAPSATGNCSLLRRKYRWTASSLFFGLRSSLLPCSRALHASILPHFRAKRKRGDSPRSFRAIYFASAVASTLPNSWPL